MNLPSLFPEQYLSRFACRPGRQLEVPNCPWLPGQGNHLTDHPSEQAGNGAGRQPSLPFPRPCSGSGSPGCCSLRLCFSIACRIPRHHFLPVGKASNLLLLRKKDSLRRQIVLPGPSLYKWSMSDSETYGLHLPGKTCSSSKANLAKGMGVGDGRAVPAHPEPWSASQRYSAAPYTLRLPWGSSDLLIPKPRH